VVGCFAAGWQFVVFIATFTARNVAVYHRILEAFSVRRLFGGANVNCRSYSAASHNPCDGIGNVFLWMSRFWRIGGW